MDGKRVRDGRALTFLHGFAQRFCPCSLQPVHASPVRPEGLHLCRVAAVPSVSRVHPVSTPRRFLYRSMSRTVLS